MRKLLPIVIIGILVLSGLGASAVIIEKDNTINKNCNKRLQVTKRRTKSGTR